MTLWRRRDDGRLYRVPEDATLPAGPVALVGLDGAERTADEAALAPFLVTPEEAERAVADLVRPRVEQVRAALEGLIGAEALPRPGEDERQAVERALAAFADRAGAPDVAERLAALGRAAGALDAAVRLLAPGEAVPDGASLVEALVAALPEGTADLFTAADDTPPEMVAEALTRLSAFAAALAEAPPPAPPESDAARDARLLAEVRAELDARLARRPAVDWSFAALAGRDPKGDPEEG